MIEIIKRCSHCKKQFPNECDGIIYYIKEWGKKRKLCKGEMEEDNSFRIKNGKPYYHYIMGFGTEWDTPLFKLKKND